MFSFACPIFSNIIEHNSSGVSFKTLDLNKINITASKFLWVKITDGKILPWYRVNGLWTFSK